MHSLPEIRGKRQSKFGPKREKEKRLNRKKADDNSTMTLSSSIQRTYSNPAQLGFRNNPTPTPTANAIPDLNLTVGKLTTKEEHDTGESPQSTFAGLEQIRWEISG